MAIGSPNSKWLARRPRRSGASSIDGRSSRINDAAWTSSIAAAAGTACEALPRHSSAERSTSEARTCFEGASAV
jgi:hypothetical protein